MYVEVNNGYSLEVVLEKGVFSSDSYVVKNTEALRLDIARATFPTTVMAFSFEEG